MQRRSRPGHLHLECVDELSTLPLRCCELRLQFCDPVASGENLETRGFQLYSCLFEVRPERVEMAAHDRLQVLKQRDVDGLRIMWPGLARIGRRRLSLQGSLPLGLPPTEQTPTWLLGLVDLIRPIWTDVTGRFAFELRRERRG